MKEYGPYTRKDGRQIIVLYDGKKTTSVSYPRRLIEVSPDEDVHHIDRNPSNNDSSNLKALRVKEHHQEHATGVTTVTLCCLVCGSHFEKKMAQIKSNIKDNHGITCSRNCSAKVGGIASGKARRNK